MATYQTHNDQDIFYVVNTTVGDLNQTYVFLVNNPTFKIDFVPVNATASYTKTSTVPLPVVSNKPSDTITSKAYYSKENQNMFDICLSTLTDLNQLYSFGVNLNESPVANSKFTYNPQNITDRILSNAALTFNTGQRITASDQNIFFLLKEDEFFLLQENLGKFIL